ncbi:MAG: hypothetical protein AAF721_10995 [Myxococcota bacterium]
MPAPELQALERVVGGHGSLRSVVHWALNSTPERTIEDIVVQDEYTHDVIVRWDDTRFLVFDTT